MEAARTSETSVDIQLRTRQYIPEDSELQNCTDLVNTARERDVLVIRQCEAISATYMEVNGHQYRHIYIYIISV
jgi:hypothetical protein